MRKLSWEGAAEDAAAAAQANSGLNVLKEGRDGDELTIANEFADMRISKVYTRNGARLLLESPKSGQWVTLDALELEALTWQNVATLSAMVGKPYQSLIDAEGPVGPEDDTDVEQ